MKETKTKKGSFMGMAKYLILMDHFTKDYGKMEKGMVMVFINQVMEYYTKVIGKIISKMVQESYTQLIR